MNKERIDELLEKYYCGSTSLEEEQELKSWFSGNGDFTGYEAEVEIFSHYDRSVTTPEPAPDFEERLIKAVEKLENEDRIRHLRQRYISILSAAATVLILISSWFLFNNRKEPRDTFSDPRLAYAETLKILNEVSVKLNHGTRALREISKVQSIARVSRSSFDKSALIISGNLKRSGLFNAGIPADSDINNNK